MKEIFTYCASILHEFYVTKPPGAPLPDKQGVFKIAYGPKEMDIVLENRTFD